MTEYTIYWAVDTGRAEPRRAECGGRAAAGGGGDATRTNYGSGYISPNPVPVQRHIRQPTDYHAVTAGQLSPFRRKKSSKEQSGLKAPLPVGSGHPRFPLPAPRVPLTCPRSLWAGFCGSHASALCAVVARPITLFPVVGRGAAARDGRPRPPRPLFAAPPSWGRGSTGLSPGAAVVVA